MANPPDSTKLTQAFLKKIKGGRQLVEMLASLPMVAFFIKNTDSQFVFANPQLLTILNCQHDWQVIGKQDRDFFSAAIAASFVEEDRLVMRLRKPLTRYVQMVPHLSGPVCWYVVSKSPIFDAEDQIAGVAVLMYELHEMKGASPSLQRLEPALKYLHMHYQEKIETCDLAQLTHLSESQFVRLFRKLIGETPMRYLIQMRIHAACQELLATDQSAGEIALKCGFYDQSAFTRAFQERIGQTPSAYRKRFLGDLTAKVRSR